MSTSHRLLASLALALSVLALPGRARAAQDPVSDGTQPAAVAAKPAEDVKPKTPEEAPAPDATTEDSFHRRGLALQKELDRLYGEGFWTYFFDDGVMPRPYMVAAQAKKSFDRGTLDKEYAEILGYLYQEFYRQYRDSMGLQDVKEPVPVLVFDSKEAYKAVREEKPELGLVNEEFVGGYFVPATGFLFQWRQEDLWHVMFHEGTHQLVQFATGRDRSQLEESPWLQEGIADYFGGHTSKLAYDEEKKGFVRTFELGQFIQDRYSTVSSAILGKGRYSALSVKDLVEMDFVSFKMAQNNQSGNSSNQVLTGLVYAQGWALVMFLNQYDNGKYRPLFDELLKEELKGEGARRTFAKIFSLESDDDWADFDAEYRDFIETDLRQMRLKSIKKN